MLLLEQGHLVGFYWKGKKLLPLSVHYRKTDPDFGTKKGYRTQYGYSTSLNR